MGRVSYPFTDDFRRDTNVIAFSTLVLGLVLFVGFFALVAACDRM